MTAGGGHTGGADGTQADNVIRFPRDWFGSKDDLIPFGPSAERITAEREARAASGGSADSAAGAGAGSEPVTAAADTGMPNTAAFDASAAMSASDFWGEGAGALHQPVEVGSDEPTGDEAEWAAELAVDAGVRPYPSAVDAVSERTSSLGHRRSVGGGFSRRLSELRFAIRGGRRPAVSAWIVASMIVLACLALVVFGTGRSPRHSQTADTTTLSADGETPAASSRAPVGVGGAVALGRARTAGKDMAREGEDRLRQQAARSGRAQTQLAARKKLAARRLAARKRRASQSTAPVRKTGTATSPTGSEQSSSSGSSGVPQAASSSQNGSAPASGAGSTGGASSGAAGPGGLGEPVGSGCNPVCSGG
jgi:hypothetical protein